MDSTWDPIQYLSVRERRERDKSGSVREHVDVRVYPLFLGAPVPVRRPDSLHRNADESGRGFRKIWRRERRRRGVKGGGAWLVVQRGPLSLNTRASA